MTLFLLLRTEVGRQNSAFYIWHLGILGLVKNWGEAGWVSVFYDKMDSSDARMLRKFVLRDTKN